MVVIPSFSLPRCLISCNYLLVHCTVRHLSGFEFGATVDSAALKILDKAFGAHVDTLLMSL